MTARPALEAILFDMDGVLIDSEPLHYASLRDLFAEFDVAYDEATHQGFVGQTDVQVIETMAARHERLDAPIEALVQARNERFSKIVDEPLNPRPGVAAVLDVVDALGVPMAVASSSSLQHIELVVRNLGFGDRFQELVSGSEMEHPKPAPDIYQDTARRLGVNIAACVVVEDSAPGVRAGVAAGAFVVAVPCPATRAHDLSPAHLQLASLEQLDLAELVAEVFGQVSAPS